MREYNLDSVTDYFRKRLLCDGWDIRIMSSPTGLLDDEGNQMESGYSQDFLPENRIITAKTRHADCQGDSTLDQVYADIVKLIYADYLDSEARIFYLYKIMPAIRPNKDNNGDAWGWLIRYDYK